MPSSTAPKRVTRPRSAKATDAPAAATDSAALQPAALQPAALQPSALSEDTIALRAYHLWLSEGCPDGRALEHWMQAQSELT